MAKMLDKLKVIRTFVTKEDGSLSAKAVRGSIWITISSILSNVLTLARSIILARLLMPEIFGLMGLCIVVIRGVEVFTQTGFGSALIQRKADLVDARDTAFTLSIIRGILLTLIMIIVAPNIANFYESSILERAIQVLSVIFIVNGFVNINTISYQKELHFKRLSYLSIVEAYVNFIVVVSLAYYLRNLWALVIGHIISAIIHLALSYIIIERRFVISINIKVARELFHYGKYITGLAIVLFIATEIDSLLIGKVLGIEILGFYVLAYTIANIVTTQISKLVSGVMLPAYSKLQNDTDKLRAFYLEVNRIIGIIIIPAAAGLVILSSEIIHVFYGDKWAPSIMPLQILAVFGAIRSFAAINGYLFNGVGKPNYDFIVGIIRLILLSVIIMPLTYYYGLSGTAVAVTIAIIIQFVVGLYLMKILIHVSTAELCGVYLKPILYSIIMIMIIAVLKIVSGEIEVIKLLLLVICGVVSYLVMSRKDVMLVLRNVNNMIVK